MAEKSSYLKDGLSKESRRGLRFQFSTLLLLSTLNGLALASASVLLFSSFTSPSPQADAVRTASNIVNKVHSERLLSGNREALASGADPLVQLSEAEKLLASVGEGGQAAAAEVLAYRHVATKWEDFVRSGGIPEQASTPGVIGGDKVADAALSPVGLSTEGDIRLAELNRALRRLMGELALLGEQTQPEWVGLVMPILPYGFVWVVGVALATLILAFRLQGLLTRPLEQLRLAARQVGSGQLQIDIPIGGAPEIQELGRSVLAMRDRLLVSIEQLDSRNEELSSLLNSLLDGVFLLDARGRILELNPRSQELVLSREDVGQVPERGKYLQDVFPSLPPEILQKRPQDGIELSFNLTSKKRRSVLLRIENLRSREVQGAYVAVIRDTTREQEIEQMKRDFLSVVTHELKTPLTSIEGYTKLLLMGKGGGLSDKQKAMAQTISTQTLTLKEMIQNLLDITRLEGSNLPINPVIIDPAEAVTIAGESIRGAMTTRNLNLEIDPADTGDARIKADPFRLQQVIGNLLSNAMKFTPEKGTIRLRAGRRGAQIFMQVADTGRGIPEESIPHLFDKFYQVAQGDTRVAGGAGLGLFICRQLVEAQGGRIEVTSKVGEGSQFTLWFPIETGDSSSTIEADAHRKLATALIGSSQVPANEENVD
jgi:two-component system sensor histidine kinase ResE